MLVRTLNLLIDNGRTAGLRDKIDTLYALGRLTDDEYAALAARLEA